ncbi:MAG: hypothetical protein ABIY56_01005 [Dokdonella sp.]
MTTVLIPVVLAAGLISDWGPKARAEDAAKPDQAAHSGRHIALSDPPPFFLHGEQPGEQDQPLGSVECPGFLFRNSFEPGQLDTILQTGFERPEQAIGRRIRYVTAAGYIIRVDRHTISIQDPLEMNKIEHWGDPHENLNGKHIKDWAGMPGWDGSRRTILMDGGAKLTMESAGAQGLVLFTSIYDGQQNLQIANTSNTILHHGMDAADTAARDAAQHDGESARFSTDPVTAMAWYDNVYNEDANFTIVPFAVPLGSTGGCANPRQTHDYFDDPRLPNT